MNKIIQIIKFLLIILIFDFIFTFSLISRLNFYEKFNPSNKHRIANDHYHHSFQENVETIDHWGPYKYKFVTNSLGFKDRSTRKIENVNISQERIIIIGDSFTEGIGFIYDDTFVGLLDRKLQNYNIEILNAGVASQSPIIYYKKIKYLIEDQKLKFDKLLIFLDISDIPDDYYYDQEYKNKNFKKIKFRDSLQEFMLKYSSIYLFIDQIFLKLNNLKEYLSFKYTASKEFNLKLIETNKYHVNLYKSLFVERGNWINDNYYWKRHGAQGMEIAKKNLEKLIDICKKYKIEATLIIYPWPRQIVNANPNSIHRAVWRNWSKEKKIDFIDLNFYFKSSNPENLIEKYFIDGDIHWNKQGHKHIYQIILEEYFKIDL